MNQAVSINGQPYSSSPNAFRYRQEFNPSCACKAAGQTWSDALKSIDDKAAAEQQGDIIVTEESAKKMARPPPAKGARGSREEGCHSGTASTRTRPRLHRRHRRPQPMLRRGRRQVDPLGGPDLYPREVIF